MSNSSMYVEDAPDTYSGWVTQPPTKVNTKISGRMVKKVVIMVMAKAMVKNDSCPHFIKFKEK